MQDVRDDQKEEEAKKELKRKCKTKQNAVEASRISAQAGESLRGADWRWLRCHFASLRALRVLCTVCVCLCIFDFREQALTVEQAWGGDDDGAFEQPGA